jgi:RHS repeat-associated protein
VQTQTLGSDTSPFTFVGRQGYFYDSEVSLYKLAWRYYDFASGRFVSRDRINASEGDANTYRYVLNRPTMLVDPEGLDPTKPEVTNIEIYVNSTDEKEREKAREFFARDPARATKALAILEVRLSARALRKTDLEQKLRELQSMDLKRKEEALSYLKRVCSELEEPRLRKALSGTTDEGTKAAIAAILKAITERTFKDLEYVALIREIYRGMITAKGDSGLAVMKEAGRLLYKVLVERGNPVSDEARRALELFTIR